jgi:hypothetical protein
LVIHQPRHPSGGGEWVCEIDELLRFGKKISTVVAKAIDGSNEFNPGEKQCMFCPARTVCAAYDKWSLELIQLEFEDLDAGEKKPELKTKLTMRQRSYLIQHAGAIRTWLDDQHQIVMNAALQGDPTPGLKAVSGRAGKRYWLNSGDAERRLSGLVKNDKLFTKKLISPTQAEKLLTKKDYASMKALVDQSESKPILVPEGDKRSAIKPVTNEFEDLTQEKDHGRKR